MKFVLLSPYEFYFLIVPFYLAHMMLVVFLKGGPVARLIGMQVFRQFTGVSK